MSSYNGEYIEKFYVGFNIEFYKLINDEYLPHNLLIFSPLQFTILSGYFVTLNYVTKYMPRLEVANSNGTIIQLNEKEWVGH